MEKSQELIEIRDSLQNECAEFVEGFIRNRPYSVQDATIVFFFQKMSEIEFRLKTSGIRRIIIPKDIFNANLSASLSLCSRKDLAKHFGVTPITIKNWERQGKISPEVVVNGRPKFKLEDVIKSIGNVQ